MSGGFTGREKVVLLLLVLLLVAGAVWRWWAPPVTQPTLNRVDSPGEGTVTGPEMITVHLAGAVRNPGVYHLPAGSRVYELLETAGGAADDFDEERVNLARPLYDGEKVVIYRVGEAAEEGGTKININYATAEELAAALPGIGDVKAAAIVDYREKHGFFTSITEIMDVRGIGEATFNNIEDLITVY